MRYYVQSKSNRVEAREGCDCSIKGSSGEKCDEQVNTTPRHTNIVFSSQEEHRQDAHTEMEEAAQQKYHDDLEYRILYKEIERIDQDFHSGSYDSAEISLTSTFNNDAEISQSMHHKLMRLIKAMIPNSTSEQKDSFIQDLFAMGIRVKQNCSTRQEFELDSQVVKQEEKTVDELIIEESNSILGSSDENDSSENTQHFIRQKPVDEVENAIPPYLGGDMKTLQSLDEYGDGVNSIVESVDESDRPAVEMASSLHRSSSSRRSTSRRYISKQPTTSSDAVDIRWEKLRNKMLNGSNSERTNSNCLLSEEIEANMIDERVETGMFSSPMTPAMKSVQENPQINEEVRTVSSRQNNEQQNGASDGSSSLYQIMNDMHQIKIGKHPSQAYRQPDDSSIYQPPTQQRNSDSFSIDGMSNSIVDDGRTEPSNIPSFDEGSSKEEKENGSSSLEGTNFINSQRNSQQESKKNEVETQCIGNDLSLDDSQVPSFDEGPMGGNSKCSSLEGTNFVNSQREMRSERSKMKEETGIKGTVDLNESQHDLDRSQRTHAFSLHPSLKDELMLRVSGSMSDKSKNSAHESTTNSADGIRNALIDDSCRNVTKLIFVKSSLTVGTEMYLPDKELDRSFFQTVNLSISDTPKKSTNLKPPTPTPVLPLSWRLSPVESLSDFILTVLDAESEVTTNYHIHRHMMAIGPRCSRYMNEVFASEDAFTFQVTLDKKTSALIPNILDFIYFHDYDIKITTDNAVALRQLAKMLKILMLEMMAANFILKDIGINNLVTYVSDCCYFNDVQVTKVVVEKCSANLRSIPISDRLWVVIEPDIFLQVISSPLIDRGAISRHLSILLREYLDLHQYEINAELFATLTSESIIPVVDRTVALPLIELSDCYNSKECEELQKRCAFTVACYWQTTPQAERHRLFALLRNLPSSLTVDFLEIVESGKVHLGMLRSEMEQKVAATTSNLSKANEQEPVTIQDFCGDLVGNDKNTEVLSWRMDPGKSYSDISIQVKFLNHDGSLIYHVHKHIIAAGANKSSFIAHHLNSDEIITGKNVCIVIELDFEGASAVPQLLDFIYSPDGELDISSENAVALHYVARAFGISTLSKKIVEFIDHDITLENIADYIVDGGYYRDHTTIATAGRLCAQEIVSIGLDSNLLEEFEPEFFEKVVSCDAIEHSAKSHVNVLIAKYFSMRNLKGDVIERLLKSVHINQIDRSSAVNVLKIVIKLTDYHGIETFEMMKKKSIDVVTKNWTELTEDDQCREELFSIFPSLTPDLLTIMFKTIDGESRNKHKETMCQQAKLAERIQVQTPEANLLRKEVSQLKNELEERTIRMLALQKELEGKLMQVDRALVRRTGRSAATIPSSPGKSKNSEFTELKITRIASTSSDHCEAILAQEPEGAWCCHDGGHDGDSITMKECNGDSITMKGCNELLEKECNELLEEYDDNNFEDKEDLDVVSDQQSISTAKVQKTNGRMCC